MAKQVKKAVEQRLRDSFRTGDPDIDKVRILQNPNKAEVQPKVKKKPNEKLIENRHNSSIVLGRDYKYDDLNDTSIGMIDITAGRIANSLQDGSPIISIEEENPENLYSTGDFDLDAARIYLSQKSDIDKLFGLPAGSLGDADSRSAVGIKADAVRIISRDSSSGVKIIVEGKDNSQGGDGDGLSGVELIAGGGKDMQPIPKATDLAVTLEMITQFIVSLETMLMSSIETQQAFNQKVATELNISPFFGAPSIPDVANLPQLGKTSLDTFSYVTWSGRSLVAQMEAFQKLHLGIIRDKESKEPTRLNIPSFASKYHKLD